MVKGHGTQTGRCVASDRKVSEMTQIMIQYCYYPPPCSQENVSVCEVQSWCPVELDQRPLSDEEGPLITGVKDYTVFIKNSIAFPRFGHEYNRKNMGKKV